MPQVEKSKQQLSTGIAGLDSILGTGLPRNRLYLIDGEPGTGKTTLALQFLLEGARNGERGLYVTLSESRSELLEVAASHGWSLEKIDLFEFSTDMQRVAVEPNRLNTQVLVRYYEEEWARVNR